MVVNPTTYMKEEKEHFNDLLFRKFEFEEALKFVFEAKNYVYTLHGNYMINDFDLNQLTQDTVMWKEMEHTDIDIDIGVRSILKLIAKQYDILLKEESPDMIFYDTKYNSMVKVDYSEYYDFYCDEFFNH